MGDRTDKILLAIIALLLGFLAGSLLHPATSVMAQAARFDHVEIVSPLYLYKGQQGILTWDRRNANVWFIPQADGKFHDPIYVTRVPFEKMDQAPR
jgi:hypothetical protein